MGRKKETGLSYTVPGLPVAITTLSVSVYSLSICVPGLSCRDVTDSMVENWSVIFVTAFFFKTKW